MKWLFKDLRLKARSQDNVTCSRRLHCGKLQQELIFDKHYDYNFRLIIKVTEVVVSEFIRAYSSTNIRFFSYFLSEIIAAVAIIFSYKK